MPYFKQGAGVNSSNLDENTYNAQVLRMVFLELVKQVLKNNKYTIITKNSHNTFYSISQILFLKCTKEFYQFVMPIRRVQDY